MRSHSSYNELIWATGLFRGLGNTCQCHPTWWCTNIESSTVWAIRISDSILPGKHSLLRCNCDCGDSPQSLRETLLISSALASKVEFRIFSLFKSRSWGAVNRNPGSEISWLCLGDPQLNLCFAQGTTPHNNQELWSPADNLLVNF